MYSLLRSLRIIDSRTLRKMLIDEDVALRRIEAPLGKTTCIRFIPFFVPAPTVPASPLGTLSSLTRSSTCQNRCIICETFKDLYVCFDDFRSTAAAKKIWETLTAAIVEQLIRRTASIEVAVRVREHGGGRKDVKSKSIHEASGRIGDIL